MAGTPCALNPKYHVFRTAVQQVHGPPGCPVFLIDCEIRYKLSDSSAKKLGRDYSDAVDVVPVLTRNRGQPSRWDLKANMSYANNHTCLYTRAVGFTLLRRNGRRSLIQSFSVRVFSLRYVVAHVESSCADEVC